MPRTSASLFAVLSIAAALAAQPSCTEIDALRAAKDRAVAREVELNQKIDALLGPKPDLPKEAVERVVTVHKAVWEQMAAIKRFDDTDDKGVLLRKIRGPRNLCTENIENAEFWGASERKEKPELAQQEAELVKQLQKIDACKHGARIVEIRARLQQVRAQLYTEETRAKLDTIPEWTKRRDQLNVELAPLQNERKAMTAVLNKMIDDHKDLPYYNRLTADLEKVLDAWRSYEAAAKLHEKELAPLERELSPLRAERATAVAAYTGAKKQVEERVRPLVEAARKEADPAGVRARIERPEPEAVAAAQAAVGAQQAVVDKKKELKERLLQHPEQRAALQSEWVEYSRTAVAQHIATREGERLRRVRDALPKVPCSDAICELALELDAALGTTRTAVARAPKTLALPIDN